MKQKARANKLLPYLRKGWKYLLNITPIILLVLIIEGTYRRASLILVVLYIVLTTYRVFNTARKAGLYEPLIEQVRGLKRK